MFLSKFRNYERFINIAQLNFFLISHYRFNIFGFVVINILRLHFEVFSYDTVMSLIAQN